MRSVINYKNTNDYLNQPLFFGVGLGLQRYDVQKHPKLEVLSKRQLSYFWIPEEFDLTKDISDFADFSEGERHIFTSNLQYQILLDSVQGRAILQSLGQYASLPELESCLNIWQFFENIHSRSYTYIIKNVYTNPSFVFDNILTTKEILARALTVCEQYNKLINTPETVEKKVLYTSLYLTLVSTNILEGLRFYVSFACSFAFGELGRMLGSAKILSKIAQDENCLTGDHEVLTDKGWKRLDSLDKTELIAQYTKDKEIEFVLPTGYVDQYYEGDLHIYKNHKNNYEFEMTSNHRVIWRDSRSQNIAENIASDFRPTCSKQIIASGLKKSGDLENLSVIDRLRIVVQADGTIRDKKGCGDGSISGYHTVTVPLTKERKKHRLCTIINQLPPTIKVKTYPVKDNPNEVLFKFWIPIEYNISKDFEWIDLLKITGGWAREFITELAYWDGHLPYGDLSHIYYSTCCSDVADSVQAVAVLSGWRCTRGLQTDNRKEIYSDMHRLNILPNKDFYSAGTSKNITKTFYKGHVYCVEVPSGMFIVRKNNKVAITGNCHLQVSQYLLNALKQESDPLWSEVIQEQQPTVIYMFQEAVEQEIEWAKYLFIKGNMLGINPEILTLYVKWLCNHRLRAIGLQSLYNVSTNNPIPWISKWLNSGDSQPAPQETELTSYLTGGGIDKTKTVELGDFSL